MKELLINPDQISKIKICKDIERIYYRVDNSIFANLPIINLLFPPIKVYETHTDMLNNENVYKRFDSYDDFILYGLQIGFPRNKFPDSEFFWKNDSGTITNPAHIIFYDLNQKEINRMNFDNIRDLDKVVIRLKSIRFLHTTISD